MKKCKVIPLLAALLSALLLLSSCQQIVVKTEAGKHKTASGELSWKFGSDGVLELEGTGTASEIPVEKDEVRRVQLKGFDAIGDALFSGMSRLEDVEIGESIQTIGAEAFSGCTALSELCIPETVKEISSSAFLGWQENQKIISEWYEGNAEYFNEWYEFAKEFADEFGDSAKDVLEKTQIDDELRCRLSAWWSTWKDSPYWTGEEWKQYAADAKEEADTWFDYWNRFGSYLTDGEEAALPEGGEDWWKDAKDLAKAISDELQENGGKISEEIRAFIERNREHLNSAEDAAKELRQYLDDHRDEISETVNSIESILSSAIEKGEKALGEVFEKYFRN